MILKPVLLHFKFDDFESIPLTRFRGGVMSEAQTDCNGNKWKLQVYPGGHPTGEEGEVALYLRLWFDQEDDEIDTKVYFFVRGASGDVVHERLFEHKFIHSKKIKNIVYGNPHGNRIIDKTNKILINGALHIDVLIQAKMPTDALYQPLNPHTKNTLKLFESGDRADVSFKVENETINAHSFILRLNSPILADFCEKNMFSSTVSGGGADDTIVIEGISSEVFRLVLGYVYGSCKLDEDTVVKLGKELITAADKYELVELKMTVENAIVRSCIINKENVSEYILLADAHTCPLLKEYAVSFFCLHARDVLRSEHSQQLRESTQLLTELLIGMADHPSTTCLPVSDMRAKLAELSLDIDGSKEVLASRLEEHATNE